MKFETKQTRSSHTKNGDSSTAVIQRTVTHQRLTTVPEIMFLKHTTTLQRTVTLAPVLEIMVLIHTTNTIAVNMCAIL